MATYYVSNSGNDANAGTELSPWAHHPWMSGWTGSATLTAGDTVLLNKGDTWHDTITLAANGSAGNPITISSYGVGDKPVIDAFTTLSSWTQVGTTSVYYASATFEAAPQMLLLDGSVREKGRYPNTGYRRISTVVTTPAPAVGQPVTFTDATLPSSPDWDGAEIVIRFDRWTLLRSVITNHTGTSITFNTPYTSLPRVGWGYFIQNYPDTLTDIGDWYYDSVNSRVYMHFGSDVPADHEVRVSTLNYCINNTGYLRTYNVIDGINCQGSISDAIRIWNNVTYINVTNCDIEYTGGDGIYQHGGTGSVIDGNNMSYNNYNAINILYPNTTTITNNIVTYTGNYEGYADSADGNWGLGIMCKGSNCVINNNTLTHIGYIPINWGGENTVVENNYIDTYCYIKDDGAGIYVFNDRTTGKEVNDNIVLNAIGAGEATDFPTTSSANGLYTDGGSSDVSFTGNIVGYISRQGYHGNLPVNVTLNGNTFFECKQFIGLWKFGNAGFWDGTGIFINGMDIQNNKFVSTIANKDLPDLIDYENSAGEMYGGSVYAEVAHFGTIDNNYYYTDNDCAVYIIHDSYQSNAPYSIARWTTEFGHDVNSVVVEPEPTYTLNSIGSNLLTNGTFNSNISGWTASSVDLTVAWDVTGIGDGGALRMTSTQNKFYWWWWSNANAVTTPISGGVIDSSKNYILRVLGKSAIAEKTLSFRLNSTGTGLEIQRFFTVGNTNTQKDVLLKNPADISSSATLRIVACDDPVATYLDNVGLYEANITEINSNTYLHFVYNETSNPKAYLLSSTMTDLEGTSYSGTIIINSWDSLVLIGTGSVLETSVTPSKVRNGSTVWSPADLKQYSSFPKSDDITLGTTIMECRNLGLSHLRQVVVGDSSMLHALGNLDGSFVAGGEKGKVNAWARYKPGQTAYDSALPVDCDSNPTFQYTPPGSPPEVTLGDFAGYYHIEDTKPTYWGSPHQGTYVIYGNTEIRGGLSRGRLSPILSSDPEDETYWDWIRIQCWLSVDSGAYSLISTTNIYDWLADPAPLLYTMGAHSEVIGSDYSLCLRPIYVDPADGTTPLAVCEGGVEILTYRKWGSAEDIADTFTVTTNSITSYDLGGGWIHMRIDYDFNLNNLMTNALDCDVRLRVQDNDSAWQQDFIIGYATHIDAESFVNFSDTDVEITETIVDDGTCTVYVQVSFDSGANWVTIDTLSTTLPCYNNI